MDICKNIDVYGRQVMSKLPVPMQVSVAVAGYGKLSD